MRFGAHLPVAGFGGERPAPSTLIGCAEEAEALGYTTLSANDQTDDPAEASSILGMLVSPHQAPADLSDRSLVGTPSDCVRRLRMLQAAGAQEVFVWPVRDEVNQLRRFADEVFPHFMEQ